MTRKEFLTFVASFDLSYKKLHKLFEFFTQEDFSFDILKSPDFVSIVGKEQTDEMLKNANMSYIEKFENKLIEDKIRLVSFEDENYPKNLLNIEDAPYFLFCKGDLGLLNTKSIAIIGTRTPTGYGKIVTEKFAKELAQNGVTIISGLAYGIDSISHRAALEVGGKTIAVLGGGFDKIYPSEHTDLAREIAEKGLLVSEYSPKVLPTRFTFPHRNRIVAGLSDGVLITEAGEKSGTIITKDYALDNGITVYAVPGNITSEKSKCPNNIILHSQGYCVLSAKDILDDIGIGFQKSKKVIQLSIDEQKIVDLLEDGEKDIEFLSEKTKMNIKNLNSLLVNLEIRDIIKKITGEKYMLV